MTTKINDDLVKKLTPPERGYRLIYDKDLKGFAVRITANGIKTFVLSYYFHGTKKRHKIGRYEPDGLTAAAARVRAGKFKMGLLDGIDPAEEKRQSDNEPTFTELTERYLETVAAKKRAGSLRNDRGHIRHLLPRWGTRQVKSITQRDVEKLHSDAKATPYHANRMLALLSKMFNLAVEWEWCARNPAEGIKKFDEDKRERWLTVDELTNLNKALDAYADQSAADVIRLLLLTGAREGEALKADWSQFDMKRGVWTKPSHHTKQKKIEHVPLSEAAVTLLRKMNPKESGPLFPGAGANGSSRVTLRRPWKQVCKAAGLATAVEVNGKRRMITRYKPTLRIHDLRHTYASHLVSNGVSLHIVGKLLGHTQSSTTQRYAHVADEAMRDATERFGVIMTAASGSKR